jgi:hypothetical protein
VQYLHHCPIDTLVSFDSSNDKLRAGIFVFLSLGLQLCTMLDMLDICKVIMNKFTETTQVTLGKGIVLKKNVRPNIETRKAC